MSVRWITLLVWAAAAASAAFWGFKLLVSPASVPPQAQTADASPLARGDLSRLLGVDAPPPVAAAAAEPAPDARFSLIGVVNPRSPQAAREGLALIAVDGKPPKAYRVGTVVDGSNVLKSVNARGATLGPQDGTATIALNLPALPAAATGTLPSAEGFTPPSQPNMPPQRGNAGPQRPNGPNVPPPMPQPIQQPMRPMPQQPMPQQPQPQQPQQQPVMPPVGRPAPPQAAPNVPQPSIPVLPATPGPPPQPQQVPPQMPPPQMQPPQRDPSMR